MRSIAGKYWIPILIFLGSILLSYKTIQSPLNLRHDWLTAHTLVNLSYYQKCSLISGYAASIMLPPDGEFDCQSVSRISTTSREIYLSYPSIWLLQILPVYQLSRWIAPEAIPDYLILRLLTLIIVRLPILVCSYFIFKFLYKRISHDRSIWRQKMAAASGTIALCGIPGFLHYTQNVYFSDMAAVAPMLMLALFCSQDRPLRARSASRNLWLLCLTLVCAGVDWYGSLGVVVASLILLIHDALDSRRNEKKLLLVSIKRYWPIAVGASLAAFLYIMQLALSGAGIEHIQEVARFRMSGSPDTSKMVYLISFGANLLYGYFPQLLLKIRVIPSLILVLGGLICTIHALRDSRAARKLALLFFLTPFLQLLLLTQHSAIHDFSGLKFTPIIVSLMLVAPLAFLMRFIRIHSRANWAFILLSLLCMSGSFNASSKNLRKFNNFDVRSQYLSLLPELMKRLPLDKQIYISAEKPNRNLDIVDRDGDLMADIFPPNQLALTGKFIYEPQRLKELAPIMNPETKSSFKINLLAYQDSINNKTNTLQCPTAWQTVGINLPKGSVMVCKTGLYLKDFHADARTQEP